MLKVQNAKGFLLVGFILCLLFQGCGIELPSYDCKGDASSKKNCGSTEVDTDESSTSPDKPTPQCNPPANQCDEKTPCGAKESCLESKFTTSCGKVVVLNRCEPVCPKIHNECAKDSDCGDGKTCSIKRQFLCGHFHDIGTCKEKQPTPTLCGGKKEKQECNSNADCGSGFQCVALKCGSGKKQCQPK